MNCPKTNKQRDYSIDVLKVIGILLIVLSHTVQTLTSNPLVDHIIDIKSPTTNWVVLVICFLRYCGVVGNNIFIICSAWLLADSLKFNIKKEIKMLFEIWIISVFFLLGTVLIQHFSSGTMISLKEVRVALFPSLYSNNWYLTTYLMFYPIHPYLNKAFNSMSQKEHLLCSIFLLFMSFGFGFFDTGPFTTFLIQWITIYCCISYMKTYLVNVSKNVKLNLLILILSIGIHLGLVLVTNYLGSKISFFSKELTYWNKMSNPVLLLICISLFNVVRNINFKASKLVMYISTISMYVYITHDNLFVRTYYRPLVWNYIYSAFRYNHILIWIIIVAFATFIFGVIVSAIYKAIFGKVSNKCTDFIMIKLESFGTIIANLFMKLK